MVCSWYGIGCLFKLLSPPKKKKLNYLALLAGEGKRVSKPRSKHKEISVFSDRNFQFAKYPWHSVTQGMNQRLPLSMGSSLWVGTIGNFPTQQIIWNLAISAISFTSSTSLGQTGCSFVSDKASQYIYIWKVGGGEIFPWKLSQIGSGLTLPINTQRIWHLRWNIFWHGTKDGKVLWELLPTQDLCHIIRDK